jgi:hypothetical protein
LTLEVFRVISYMNPSSLRVCLCGEFPDKLSELEVVSNPLTDFFVSLAYYCEVSSHTSAVVRGVRASHSSIEVRATVA